MNGIHFFRIFSSLDFRHLSVPDYSPAGFQKMNDRYEMIHRNIFYASVMATAFIWGIAFALMMFQPDEYNAQMIMTVLMCGLCAGGVVAFLPCRWLSICFDLFMLMPTAIALILFGQNIYLATLIVLFSIYLMIVANRGNREYWDALENEHLLELKSDELVRLSNTDVLTGLYNRRYFNQALELEWKRCSRDNSVLSVIIFDIDHFKKINDTFGHQAGDEYLTRLAAALDSVFKRDYDVVARYGGEEFIVLLPGITGENAWQLAEEARENIESMTLRYQDKDITTTISAGIMCCVPDYNVSSDYIVSCADHALYQAKQTGRNKVIVFTPVLDDCDVRDGILISS